MAKVQNLNFHNSSNNLVETFTRNMHDFWGVNLMCTFRGYIYRNFYSRMAPC